MKTSIANYATDFDHKICDQFFFQPIQQRKLLSLILRLILTTKLVTEFLVGGFLTNFAIEIRHSVITDRIQYYIIHIKAS